MWRHCRGSSVGVGRLPPAGGGIRGTAGAARAGPAGAGAMGGVWLHPKASDEAFAQWGDGLGILPAGAGVRGAARQPRQTVSILRL